MATQKRNNKQSESVTTRTPKKGEVSQSKPKKERFRLNDNQRWVICFSLFFVSAFATLAILSHYFTWREVQMGVDANAGGRLGVLIAQLLVGKCFGVFSLCVPVVGFVLSVSVGKRENYHLLKLVKVLLLLMIVGSVTLGFIAGTKGDIFGYGLGGGIGIDVAKWLVAQIGSSGMGLMLCMCWIFLALYVNSTKTIEVLSLFARKFVSLFRRREDDDEEESYDVLSEDDDEEEEYEEYEKEAEEAGGEPESVEEPEPDFEEITEEELRDDFSTTEGVAKEEMQMPADNDFQDVPMEIITEEPEEEFVEVTERANNSAFEDDDFLEVSVDGEVVGGVTTNTTPMTTKRPARTVTKIDDDFEIVENAVEGMRYLSSESAPQEEIIGTGGVVETSADGTMTVLQSEHSDEEAGKIGTLYDPTKELAKFQRPSVEILEKYDEDGVQFSTEEINENKTLIQQTLDSFNIKIKKITATVGPTVTLYEIEPEMGVKVAKIKSLEDDIAISLKAMSIRLIVPMPGRGTIGIEIPNRTRRTVSMYSMVRSKKFQESKAALPVVIGKTIQNETFVFDLADMPHMIVAGATGQGKSVGLNAIITSLLYKKHPAELKFVMVDPKKVELSLYSRLEKHYLAKMESEEDAILTDTQKVVYTLNSLCNEMEERYKLLRAAGVKKIDAYNQKFLERKLHPKYGHRYLPYLVVVIDEFADMIMTAGKEVEGPIVRLGQLARAIGIHLIIATQRPDAKVITGLISANCPARIAFKVTNRINSQIILGGVGAEKLIGKGDMLVQINGAETRLQCALVDTPEIERVIDFISRQRGYSSAYLLPDYVPEDGGVGEHKEDVGDLDSMFEEVSRFVVANQQGSTSFIQRRFKIGYNRAGRIMDQLEAYGIVGKSEGSKPREVLISDPSSLEKLLNDIFIENM